jgi:hypothetical protein
LLATEYPPVFAKKAQEWRKGKRGEVWGKTGGKQREKISTKKV